MDLSKFTSGKTRIIAVAIPALIILFPLGYSVVSSVFAHTVEMPQPFLERPDPQYTECVRDSIYMRYHHWELLRNVREEVVRYGRRGDIGLKKCGTCHISREKFCDQCHHAISMTPDCFNCHYYP